MTRDTQDKMVAPVAMMNTEAQTPAMMKKEEVKPEAMMMKKEESTMMKSETGYGVYSDATLATALQAGQKIYIFFHATWCPSCQALDGNIRENISSIPANVLILKADYDTETSLKQKYGVTVQTTVIALNTDGSLAKKTIGVSSVAELLK